MQLQLQNELQLNFSAGEWSGDLQSNCNCKGKGGCKRKRQKRTLPGVTTKA